MYIIGMNPYTPGLALVPSSWKYASFDDTVYLTYWENPDYFVNLFIARSCSFPQSFHKWQDWDVKCHRFWEYTWSDMSVRNVIELVNTLPVLSLLALSIRPNIKWHAFTFVHFGLKLNLWYPLICVGVDQTYSLFMCSLLPNRLLSSSWGGQLEHSNT